jgi:NAD(P)-dependent dehydrogenase (short-subunit alcohol dehydrogenase family)
MGNGRFTGKAVVVTGGASGFGRATAARFVEEGAQVALIDLDPDTVRSAARSLGDRVLPLAADVSSPEEMQSAAQQVIAEFGGVDVIFANAGIEGVGTAADLEVDDWNRVIGVNLTGVWLTSRYLLPGMVERGSGAIINTASIGGLVGVPGIFPYAAAKAGVIGLTRQMAIDYAQWHIRVNAICPGTVVTPLVERNWLKKGADVEEQTGLLAQRYPLGQGEVSDVAGTVLFLAGDESRWITGVALPVDGGYTAA